jgi:hypothetical protein
MTFQQPTDRLITLRENLRHFEQSRDFGDGIDAFEIRKLLVRQIAEVDGALQRLRALALRRPKAAA